MRRQVASEYRKLISTRTAYGLLTAMVGLIGFGVLGVMSNADPATLAMPLDRQPFIVVPILTVYVFVLVLGLRSFTDEFRHGSIVPTLLVTPSRGRVVAGKLASGATAGAVFGLVAVAASFGFGAAWLAAQGHAVGVSAQSLGEIAGRFILVGALWSALGVGVGLAVRHQVAAIAGALVWVLVGENLVGGMAPGLAKYLPASASFGALGLDGDRLLGPAAGLAVLAAWAVGAVAIGALSMRHRDVT